MDGLQYPSATGTHLVSQLRWSSSGRVLYDLMKRGVINRDSLYISKHTIELAKTAGHKKAAELRGPAACCSCQGQAAGEGEQTHLHETVR